jgi:AcrR family transcriptional regulator
VNRNLERGRSTRTRLLEIATRLFTEHGYDNTSTEAVLRESGVSRGSLYHHFASKEALFLAVLDRVDERVRVTAEAAMEVATDPIDALRIAYLTWIALANDPEVRRLVLLDAPAVLGWQRWRAAAEQGTLGRIEEALGWAADRGRIEQRHVRLFAHVVLAATTEIALVVATSPDPAAATRDGQDAYEELLRRLVGATS